MVPVRSHAVMNLQPDGATAILSVPRPEAPLEIRATKVRVERWRGASSHAVAESTVSPSAILAAMNCRLIGQGFGGFVT